jgi:hypothetical protein
MAHPLFHAGCVLALLLASGCALNPAPPELSAAQSQGIAAESTSPAEHDSLLALVARLQTGESGSYEGMMVEAGAPFFAASGRICKHITLRGPDSMTGAHSRLACQADHGWFFAADVFTSEARGG